MAEDDDWLSVDAARERPTIEQFEQNLSAVARYAALNNKCMNTECCKCNGSTPCRFCCGKKATCV